MYTLLLIAASLGLLACVAAQPTPHNLRTLTATFGGCLLAVVAVRCWPEAVGTALNAALALGALWLLARFVLWPLRIVGELLRCHR